MGSAIHVFLHVCTHWRTQSFLLDLGAKYSPVAVLLRNCYIVVVDSFFPRITSLQIHFTFLPFCFPSPLDLTRDSG